jgi:EAL domain-containing protein (putative c-di-GMP-specific phosphodiesterase class I)
VEPLRGGAETLNRSDLKTAVFSLQLASLSMLDSNSESECNYSTEMRLPLDEIELWFQPVYQLRLGNVLHNEVLVRWRDDSGNLHVAKELLPFVQRVGLMCKLDDLVIDKVLEVMTQMPDITFSVNLSSDSLQDPELQDRIQLGLKQAGVSPRHLGFEIKEEAIANNFEIAAAFMTGIKKLGCHVTIDSFMGEYLPLSRLQSLPVDAVKIDRTIVQNLHADPGSRDLIGAIVQINTVWGWHCIAKGVGDASTLKLVREIGIECAQGYFLKSPESKPAKWVSVTLFVGRVLSILVTLYVIKSAIGIDFFPDRHIWEVIGSALEPLFKFFARR